MKSKRGLTCIYPQILIKIKHQFNTLTMWVFSIVSIVAPPVSYIVSLLHRGRHRLIWNAVNAQPHSTLYQKYQTDGHSERFATHWVLWIFSLAGLSLLVELLPCFWLLGNPEEIQLLLRWCSRWDLYAYEVSLNFLVLNQYCSWVALWYSLPEPMGHSSDWERNRFLLVLPLNSLRVYKGECASIHPLVP